MKLKTKIISITSIVLVLALATFFYVRYYFVFGEGVKAGELNYIVYKGYIFKTYEGLLIQSGFKSKNVGTIQSIEFKFSVEDKAVADTLMHNGGKNMQLHYKEYFKPLWWRGMSEFVVDKIVFIDNATETENYAR
ncbi:MAG: hypothetical protein LBB53_04180 [Prevotellaceae bacterium]|jgi:hypothetical protein|nr:hypothetical protein [Prevotellaceae bacterium]